MCRVGLSQSSGTKVENNGLVHYHGIVHVGGQDKESEWIYLG